MLNKMIGLLLAVGCLLGCKDDEVENSATEDAKREKFLQQTVSGVYDGDIPLLAFDEMKHQMAFTADGRVWRLQTDSQDKYVHCELSATPASGARVTVNVKAKGVNEVLAGKQEGVVLKQENNKCWLWSTDAGVGYLMQNNE